jgi:hypothetical protein
VNYILTLEFKVNGPTGLQRERKRDSYFIKERERERKIIYTDREEWSGKVGERYTEIPI